MRRDRETLWFGCRRCRRLSGRATFWPVYLGVVFSSKSLRYACATVQQALRDPTLLGLAGERCAGKVLSFAPRQAGAPLRSVVSCVRGSRNRRHGLLLSIFSWTRGKEYVFCSETRTVGVGEFPVPPSLRFSRCGRFALLFFGFVGFIIGKGEEHAPRAIRERGQSAEVALLHFLEVMASSWEPGKIPPTTMKKSWVCRVIRLVLFGGGY